LYDLELIDSFRKDFDNTDKLMQEMIFKKIQYIREENVSRKHLHFGSPYFIAKVTTSSRIVYKIYNQKIICIRFFKDHKDYEHWYKKG